MATLEGRLRFIQRHGDPTGELNKLDEDGVFRDYILDSNLGWDRFARNFAEIAKGWTAPNHDGTSHRGKADGLARDLVEQLTHIHPKELPVHFDQRHGWLIRPKTLLAFMAFSAVDNWTKSTPHRQCRQCGDWFVLRDKRSRFCSNSCATNYRRNKETPHGKEAA